MIWLIASLTCDIHGISTAGVYYSPGLSDQTFILLGSNGAYRVLPLLGMGSSFSFNVA